MRPWEMVLVVYGFPTQVNTNLLAETCFFCCEICLLMMIRAKGGLPEPF